MSMSSERRSFQQIIAMAAAICFVLGVSVMSTVGQIPIGGGKVIDLKIPGSKKPVVKNPTNPNGTPGNSPGTNQPATANGNGGGNSSASHADPPAELVNAFRADAAPYKGGINELVYMQDHMGKDWAVIPTADLVRKTLDQVAALAAIIRQKYPNIENPSWANNWEDKVGDWRHLAEDREQVVKAYLSDKVGAVARNKAQELDKHRANMSTLLGYALPVDFTDREKAHAEVAQEFAPMFAAVGMTVPDNSAFAAYDTALDALIAEEKKQAGEWGWGATFHDPTIEAKARSWLLQLDPQAKVISMGLTDAAWQVNKNSIGIPEGRYRRGLVMYRKPGVELCVVAKFSFEQSYEGAGRYSAMSNTSGFTYQVRLQTCK